MPVLMCPSCDNRHLVKLETSSYTYVDYYRCEACGHVWTADKKTNELVNHVTPLRKSVRQLA